MKQFQASFRKSTKEKKKSTNYSLMPFIQIQQFLIFCHTGFAISLCEPSERKFKTSCHFNLSERKKNFSFYPLLKNVCVSILKERMCKGERKGIPSWLRTVSTEPRAGLKLKNRDCDLSRNQEIDAEPQEVDA